MFRVNTEDNSYTAVSEEARAIALRDGRFIYIRSDEYLTAENLWTVPYYTNSLEWNDERKISAEKAMKLMDGTRRTGFMDGRVSYTVDVAGDTVRIEMENGGEYTVRIPFEQLSGLDKDSLGFGSIAALARDKLYFSAHYVSEGVYREDLFVVGLDGKGLRMLTHEAFTGMFGLDATLDESGNLWFLYPGAKASCHHAAGYPERPDEDGGAGGRCCVELCKERDPHPLSSQPHLAWRAPIDPLLKDGPMPFPSARDEGESPWMEAAAGKAMSLAHRFSCIPLSCAFSSRASFAAFLPFRRSGGRMIRLDEPSGRPPIFTVLLPSL